MVVPDNETKQIIDDTVTFDFETSQALNYGALKQQLYAGMLEIIGEDEPVITKIGKGSISRGTVVFTNQLRQEQRQKLNAYFGVKGEG